MTTLWGQKMFSIWDSNKKRWYKADAKKVLSCIVEMEKEDTTGELFLNYGQYWQFTQEMKRREQYARDVAEGEQIHERLERKRVQDQIDAEKAAEERKAAETKQIHAGLNEFITKTAETKQIRAGLNEFIAETTANNRRYTSAPLAEFPTIFKGGKTETVYSEKDVAILKEGMPTRPDFKASHCIHHLDEVPHLLGKYPEIPHICENDDADAYCSECDDRTD